MALPFFIAYFYRKSIIFYMPLLSLFVGEAVKLNPSASVLYVLCEAAYFNLKSILATHLFLNSFIYI